MEPPQLEERTFERKTDLPSDRFIMAFRTDPAGSDEDLTLDVIATKREYALQFIPNWNSWTSPVTTPMAKLTSSSLPQNLVILR